MTTHRNRAHPLQIAFTLVVSSALASACAASQRWTPGTPSGSGEGWHEVTTPHFRLRTDFDANEAPRIAATLEEMYAELSELGFASEDRPKGTIDVVYFRRHEDYVKVFPNATVGIAFPRGQNDFERRPTLALGGDFVNATREIALHELTHHLVHYYFPQAPRWLDEGLAQYFETLVVEDGTAILGRALPRQRFWKGPWQHRWDPRGGRTLIPMGDAPTEEALRSMSARTFYGDLGQDATTSDGRDGARTRAVNYQAAWCLVHLLLSDGSYSPAFTKYLAELHAGTRSPEAWRSTLGLLSAEKLETDYRAALVPVELSTLRTKIAAPVSSGRSLPSTPAAAGAMDVGETRVLFARLRDWSTPEGRAAAQADLEAASASDDSQPETVATRAKFLATGGDFEGAERVLRAATVTNRGDRSLWNALGSLTLMRVARGEPVADRLPAIARELEGADTTAEIDLVARVRASEGKADLALAEEKRALALDPNCIDCLEAAATILSRVGRYSEALETGEMAIGLAGESHSVGNFVRVMDTWRQHLGDEKAAAPSAPVSSAAPPVPAPAPIPHADAVLGVLRGRFGSCFSAEGSAGGDVELEAHVNARGEVTGVTPGASSLPEPIVACLVGILGQARFPAPGVDTTLAVPLHASGNPNASAKPH